MAKIRKSITDTQVVTWLREGKIGILPTDTLYGVVALASDQTAVERLYASKARADKPGTLIAASIDQLIKLGLKGRYVKAVAHLWPNPLSIVIPITPTELFYLHRGANSLAVRIPNDQAVLSLLHATGPLLTTSANPPGEPPATNLAEARGYFGDNVDFYVDGGDLSARSPSTIIRIVDDAIEVLRPGALHIDETTGKISD